MSQSCLHLLLSTIVDPKTYSNSHKLSAIDEAKRAHSMRKQRAMVHRAAMLLKEALDKYKPQPIKERKGGNGEALPQSLPPQSLPPQNLPQNLPPRNLPSHDFLPRDRLSHHLLPQSQDKGPGLVYSADHDTTTLDQVIGLTTNQTWVQPECLPPHAFSFTPMLEPMPPWLPPRVEAPQTQIPSNVRLPLFTESDFIMDDYLPESSQYNPDLS